MIPAGEQFLMLVRDVTREVRLEQMRKDFVANASHELRSPLTVISGYLDELANEEGIGAEWRDPIADMRRQALRMREIVEDLLELSRLEATADEAPMAPVDMPALLERLVREAEMSGADAPKFELRRRPGLPAARQRVRALLGRLEPDHATRSSTRRPKARSRSSGGRENGGARLVVRDTGIGIAPEHLPRLTERFYRVDRARARAKGGSGLGLSIVKHGLQRHGGRLEIESEEGRGSTFTAHFPARRVIARAAPAIKAS